MYPRRREGRATTIPREKGKGHYMCQPPRGAVNKEKKGDHLRESEKKKPDVRKKIKTSKKDIAPASRAKDFVFGHKKERREEKKVAIFGNKERRASKGAFLHTS